MELISPWATYRLIALSRWSPMSQGPKPWQYLRLTRWKPSEGTSVCCAWPNTLLAKRLQRLVKHTTLLFSLCRVAVELTKFPALPALFFFLKMFVCVGVFFLTIGNRNRFCGATQSCQCSQNNADHTWRIRFQYLAGKVWKDNPMRNITFHVCLGGTVSRVFANRMLSSIIYHIRIVSLSKGETSLSKDSWEQAVTLTKQISDRK